MLPQNSNWGTVEEKKKNLKIKTPKQLSWKEEQGHSRKAQLKEYSNHIFPFYQEGVIHHSLLQMPATVVLIFNTKIWGNESDLVKNKVDKYTEPVWVVMPWELGTSRPGP